MLEKGYTWEAAVREDSESLSIKLKALHDKDDSHGYLIKLEEIASVSDDTVPTTYRPAPLPNSTVRTLSFITGRPIPATGESPLLRALYTEGHFVNPVTQNPALMVYKHPDRCVTVTLKHAVQLGFGGRDPNFMTRQLEPFVREFSFEVEDKAATKEMIQDALPPTPEPAAPRTGMKFCPSCGVQMVYAAKFCPSCGTEQPT